MDMQFVADTLALQEQVEERTNAIGGYLHDHHIDDLWEAFVREARAEAGLTAYAHDEYRQPGCLYAMRVTDESVLFEGDDYDGFEVSYAIPLGFLFPETREAAKEQVRTKYATLVARDAEKRAREAAQQRAFDEEQFAALAAKLGKTL